MTPRFPDGFTVLDGRCQWRGPGEGGIVKEDSKVLVIAMPDEPHRRARLDEIATAYKRRFRQNRWRASRPVASNNPSSKRG